MKRMEKIKNWWKDGGHYYGYAASIVIPLSLFTKFAGGPYWSIIFG